MSSDQYLLLGYEWATLEELCVNNGLILTHIPGSRTEIENATETLVRYDWGGHSNTTVAGLRMIRDWLNIALYRTRESR